MEVVLPVEFDAGVGGQDQATNTEYKYSDSQSPITLSFRASDDVTYAPAPPHWVLIFVKLSKGRQSNGIVVVLSSVGQY